tara:strand:- start:66 stop:431 length:366 start_codon:yes stop_codon:yes gene_type:complete
MVKNLIFVFIGGGLGSMLRFLISKINYSNLNFPVGTLFVNILGSFLIGIIIGYGLKNNNSNNSEFIFLATGFCGGFTTFSAFSAESLEMLNSGSYNYFFIYSSTTIIAGIFFAFLGLSLTK